jgi:hypothetical protein
MIRSAAIASASLALLIAASTASAQTAPAETTAQAQPDMVVSGQTEQDDRALRSRTCLRSTGSRIIATRNERAEKSGKGQKCVAAAGRVYTRSDLDSTGHTNIVDALRMLDTSIR